MATKMPTAVGRVLTGADGCCITTCHMKLSSALSEVAVANIPKLTGAPVLPLAVRNLPVAAQFRICLTPSFLMIVMSASM